MAGIDLSKIPDPTWDAWKPEANSDISLTNQKTAGWQEKVMTGLADPEKYGTQNKAAADRAARQAWRKKKQGASTGATATTDTTMPSQFDWGSLFKSYYPEYGQESSYQLPQEMDWASDVLGEYAYTGRPTSYSDWYQQAKGGVTTDVMDAIKQAAEQANISGLRNSSVLGAQAGDIASRAWQNLGTQFMGYENQSLENAANRGLTAAQALPGLAQQRQQMPIDFANASYNMGTGMQGTYQNMLNSLQQNWQNQQTSSNPWLQYAMQLAQMSPSGGGSSSYGQQTYQPSCLSQGLGAAGSLGGLFV